MNKRHYEHTLPNIRGSLSNTYLVLWGYRMDIKEISRERWNGMGQHGQIRIKFMGYGPVRIHTDNENHTVTVYRINDSL